MKRSQNTKPLSMVEAAKEAFRLGFAPLASRDQLQSLLDALKNDDPRLVQGMTAIPSLDCVSDWPVEGCCAISWLEWGGTKPMTSGEIRDLFSRACCDADKLIKNPDLYCGDFLYWFDATPRNQMRAELAELIESILEERKELN